LYNLKRVFTSRRKIAPSFKYKDLDILYGK